MKVTFGSGQQAEIEHVPGMTVAQFKVAMGFEQGNLLINGQTVDNDYELQAQDEIQAPGAYLAIGPPLD